MLLEAPESFLRLYFTSPSTSGLLYHSGMPLYASLVRTLPISGSNTVRQQALGAMLICE